ncbi:MAG: beta-N-acetylhexosaminidase [Saprospiraceae bacterium]|nr:beta-N-acetylhexosaminidase [Saprospiraceae bacterium]
MMIINCLVKYACVAVCLLCCPNPISTQNVDPSFHGIIPAPNEKVFASGDLSDIMDLKIYLKEEDKSAYLISLVKSIKNASFVTLEKANLIPLIDHKTGAESYLLDILKDKIDIKAGDKAGLQYALVSLSQMVIHGGYPLPIVKLKDSPKFKYRGMHLDVARHFFSVSDVKKYLDYMAYYKFNQFHWHLTDDQGWRIEIKKYPKLQEIGAYRNETLIGHYNDQPHKFDGKRYGGFYTQEEVKEIVSYATVRNIEIIPEIEMPGHALAALAAYPEFGCENKKYEVATKWGVFEDVFCPNEVTFRFLEDVIDEVINLFPGRYIHIGGDECPKSVWKKSAFCQELIRKNSLKDEEGLQNYFITRMEKYINSKGKQIIGWDEIMEGGLAPNATVMSWRGIEGGLAAARANHDAIMTPGTHCYFDHYQSESAKEPLAIGGYTSIEKVYDWEPIPEKLAADKSKYILGGQSNLWSEYIREYSGVEYMVYARGLAMAEALWSKQKNYADFLQRYEKHYDYWKTKGANIAYHLYELKPKIIAGKGNPVTVSFVLPNNSNVIHTVNGKLGVNITSGEETKIATPGTHTFQAVNGEKKGSPLDINFDLHLATGAILTMNPEPSKQYYGNGPGSIINGVKGSNEKYGGSEWLGFNGKDCTGVLDFGKDVVVSDITFRFFKGEGQWIYLPKKAAVFSSDDGVVFTLVSSTEEITAETKVSTIDISLKDIRTRYLKFEISNYGIIPDGAQGAGHGAWLFVDEVVVMGK